MGVGIIFDTIKYILFNSKKNNVKLSIGSNINSNVKFQGANKIGKMTNLRNCTWGYASYCGENCTIGEAAIGKYCSVGDRVHFIGGMHPSSDFVSTHPAFYSVRNQAGIKYVNENKFDEYKFISNNKAFIIGNDVWIGSDAKIMQGVQIGDGAIIAAGALVIKDVAPYEIVGGVPAKHIKFRFSQEQIDRLLQIEWWNYDEEKIRLLSDSMIDIEQFLIQIDTLHEKDDRR